MWIRDSFDNDEGEIGYKGGGGTRSNVDDIPKAFKELEVKEGEADEG